MGLSIGMNPAAHCSKLVIIIRCLLALAIFLLMLPLALLLVNTAVERVDHCALISCTSRSKSRERFILFFLVFLTRQDHFYIQSVLSGALQQPVQVESVYRFLVTSEFLIIVLWKAKPLTLALTSLKTPAKALCYATIQITSAETRAKSCLDQPLFSVCFARFAARLSARDDTKQTQIRFLRRGL